MPRFIQKMLQKIDENEGSEAIEVIDKYITCALPDEIEYPEMNKPGRESADPPSCNHVQEEK